MKNLFDSVSRSTAKNITKTYSTSFSLGVRMLHQSIRPAIYNIYGFVRIADEIVDSFHDYPQAAIFERFKTETFLAIKDGISTNPVLNAFQQVVNDYEIDHAHIQAFFNSMEMDLNRITYSMAAYHNYIYGSAEAVGLMCLHVFCGKDKELYNDLQEPARKLGSAFQKVNFLRDLKQDYRELGRLYFPGVSFNEFNDEAKRAIENDIDKDFDIAFQGIQRLPSNAKLGVYLAYKYFKQLLKKIKSKSAIKIANQRVRIRNSNKLLILMKSYMRHQVNVL